MENSIKARETIEQIGIASVQLTRGCELVAKNGAKHEDIQELECALCEMHATARTLLESMTKIDPALDHDDDTQPGNEKPERKAYQAPAVTDVQGTGLERISVYLSAEHRRVLAALGKNGGYTTADETVMFVVASILDGVRRPGSWERELVWKLFGDGVYEAEAKD